MHFLREGLNDLPLGTVKMLIVFELNRTQSRELLLESGIALHAGKQWRAARGLFQRQLLPQSAGTLFCIHDGFPHES